MKKLKRAVKATFISGGSKKYANYEANRQERRRLEKGGCSHIKIRDGKVVSYRNKAGDLIGAEV